MSDAPPITAIVESALYVDDLAAAVAFYGQVLGLEPWGHDPERHAFFQVGGRMLLLFLPEATLRGELLPPHGGHGPGHVALGIPAEEYELWKERLAAHGVAIEQELTWPLGGRSLYFRDPAGNSLELITPGVWGTATGW